MKKLPQNYHNSDPESSKIAAKKHKKKRLRNIDIVYNGLHGYCEYYTSKPTSRELSKHLIKTGYLFDKYEVSRRFSDLKSLGKVKSGKYRKCAVSHTACLEWSIA